MSARSILLSLGALALCVAAFLALTPRMVQDEAYHMFADQRTIAGVRNFWNVVSNVAFVVAGILGLRISRDWTGRVLFIGVFLTCFGSAYYHLAPSDARLVWDRLPMTLVFMALPVCIIGRRLEPRLSRWLLVSLVAAGLASVFWWRINGDLRPYVLVQFGSVLALLLAVFGSGDARGLWPVLVLYVLAKFTEQYDGAIYATLPLSGHTWKHLLAALAACWIYRWHRASELSHNFVTTSEGLPGPGTVIVR